MNGSRGPRRSPVSASSPAGVSPLRPLHEQVRVASRARKGREWLLAAPSGIVGAFAIRAEGEWLRARFGLENGELLAVQLGGSLVVVAVVSAVVGWLVSRREPRVAPTPAAP